jgi:exoribonuclease II
MKMKIFGIIIGSAFLLLTMTSCSSVSYMPKVSLDSSPSVINKNVKFEKLTDSSPKSDQENPFMGFSVTNPEALSSELTTEITNETARDFQTNDVFQKINKYEKDPEIFITGEIRKFQGVTKFTKYGLISFITVLPIYTWYLGISIKKKMLK